MFSTCALTLACSETRLLAPANWKLVTHRVHPKVFTELKKKWSQGPFFHTTGSQFAAKGVTQLLLIKKNRSLRQCWLCFLTLEILSTL